MKSYMIDKDEAKVDDYIKTRKSYFDKISKLRKDYPAVDPKGKKFQKFTVVKSKAKSKTIVKYLNKDLKLAELPQEDAKPLIDFQSYDETFGKEFDKKISPSMKDITKGLTKEQAKERKEAMKLDPIRYLLLSVVKTQNIIDIDFLSKCSRIQNEFINKTTSSCLELLTDKEIEKLLQSQEPEIPYAPLYIQLFIDIQKFNGSNYGRLCKTIYNHREGIVRHEKLTNEMKKNAWLQANSNINGIKQLISNNPDDKLVYNAWVNVLSSKYAFHIVMNMAPPNDYFKKGFELLIQQPLSVKLFESALYPISFLFTPNMLGKPKYKPEPKLFTSADPTYKKTLVEELQKFGSPTTNLFNYNDFNWLYYFDKKEENVMLSVLHRIITWYDQEKPVRKPRTTTTEKKEKPPKAEKKDKKKKSDE